MTKEYLRVGEMQHPFVGERSVEPAVNEYGELVDILEAASDRIAKKF